MSAPRRILLTWDYDTWTEIAEALGVPVRTAQRWADLAVDPLPVTRMMDSGRVKGRGELIQAWLDRRFAGRRPSPDEDPVSP